MKTVNGVEVLTTIEELVDPRRTAIMVVDMQNEIVSERGGYAKRGADVSHLRSIIPRINRLLEDARKIGILVAYAEFIHQNQYGKMIVNGPESWCHRNSEWTSNVVEGTWESRTIDELAPHEGDAIIRKSRGSAFYNTYLDDILKEKAITNLILTGTATDGCVLRTAVEAMSHGYYAVIVMDCVSPPPGEFSNYYLKGNFPTFQSDEILAAWEKLKK